MSKDKMPKMPKVENNDAAPKPVASTPAPVAPAPEIKTPEKDIDNVKEVKPLSGAVEVVATRKGFYGQRRISIGEKFSIKSKEHFGAWFKCVEAGLEKERKHFLQDKKDKALAVAKEKSEKLKLILR